MKILFITPTFLPTIGGTEKVIHEISHRLIRLERYEVTIVTPWREKNDVKSEDWGDVREIKRVAESSAVIILAEATEYADHSTYWDYSVEEWKNIFAPWKLVWKTERKLVTATHHSGTVMRFEGR
ncbi:unnamed protein product [marine sediment metagenome]|uniref:Uncharacterized protein n=1 Tax=marine sediment metagenome TaxID=412755 RepID=X1KTM6_9ZZZZ